MLANVQQTTIQPIIAATVAKGALIHTDEYGIYARLPAWGYQHKTVCHGRGEYARDEDGDGFCEVHVNTIEGFCPGSSGRRNTLRGGCDGHSEAAFGSVRARRLALAWSALCCAA
jgi:hypothetical protein